MTERTLGIATIGQAPRDDIAALFSEQTPSSSRILLRGCLDNLADDQIAQRPPMDGADTLYTRLRGGVDAKISKTQFFSFYKIFFTAQRQKFFLAAVAWSRARAV